MKYQTGNLFDAPKGSYLAHACNCKGSWGAGVALEFKKRFPKSYQQYRKMCNLQVLSPGDMMVCSLENGHQVICLLTSYDFGYNVDAPYLILDATKQALSRMPTDKPIHMPRINSGFFNVPWWQTELLLEGLDVTVWELEETHD